mgnify:CR=1 FL=1
MTKNKLAIIGGSGLYEIEGLESPKWKSITTPWGKPSDEILSFKYKGKEVCFLPRHARGHKISPTNINFRANIDALKQLDVTDIISVSAVGSLKENLSPGTFVIVDQFIDRTVNRIKSFFDDGIVAHVPMANPVSKELMLLSKSTLKNLQIPYNFGATYLAMEGPQFSSLAESNLYRQWGCDVIGMTNMPEAKLAREAEIRYCSISMVTDYDCWHSGHDSVDLKLVIKTLNENVDKSKLFIKMFSESYYQGIDFSKDKTSSILDTSIVTHKDSWNKDVENKLSFILKRYKEHN